VIVDSLTAQEAEAVLVDSRSGRRLIPPDFQSAAGPAADVQTQQRYVRLAASRSPFPSAAKLVP
jgi:hypothetical protein